MFLFKVENLTYYYPESERPALNNINLTVKEGEFLLVIGGSGSGKSSLARALAGLVPDFYGGKFGGKVFFNSHDLRKMDRRNLGKEIGIVFQDPEKQLVMLSVEAEIAFGLENLGLPPEDMLRRVAEVMGFLNLTPVKSEFTTNLSGGQKQKLALAAILAMQPRVLILDEPTSQLDPMSAEELLNLVKRLNEEMGYTIILIEQRLERCFHLADRILVMENGRIVKEGPAEEVARWEVENSLPFVPPVARFFASLQQPRLPLTIKEGRQALGRYFSVSGPQGGHQPSRQTLPNLLRKPVKKKKVLLEPEPASQLKDVWFTYPNGREALRGINLSVKKSEFVVVLGENAAGKSTLLKQMAGLLQPGRGSVVVAGKDTRKISSRELAREVGYLAQNPNNYLFCDTVEQELLFTLNNLGLSCEDRAVEILLERLDIARYRKVNPRDLSSGERQRVALAAVLVARPKILLLDEPTRGLDYRLKNELGLLLRELAQEGLSVVLVTHDVEFCAEHAARVIIMFDGRIIADGPPEEILNGSLFYSPQMNRLFKGYAQGVLTVQDGIRALALNGDFPYVVQA